MKQNHFFHLFSLGLAIFSMFFGAGNLIYPIMVGMDCAQHPLIGIASFLLTSVFLPLLGLIAMVLFNGNFETFFARLGQKTGTLMVACCMIIIGPLIAMPRIATLSHTMIAPFIPFAFLQEGTYLASAVFAVLFFAVTFLCTFRENKIVNLLGSVISPILLGALCIIVVKGWLFGSITMIKPISSFHAFSSSFMRGYESLDLLGALFFSFVILSLIKKTNTATTDTDEKRAILVLKAGAIGLSCLALVYIGLSTLGILYGHLLPTTLNGGQIFREISSLILGARGSFIISLAVLMACLSTAIALTVVFAEYVRQTTYNRISFVHAVVFTLLLCMPLSIAGLSKVLALTAGPIVFIGYPIIIALTFCNLAYKLFGFKPVRIPVLITTIIATILYYWPSITPVF